MNKFSFRSISAAAALVALVAAPVYAQSSVGVRTGVNANISSDVRANAMGGGNASTSSEADIASRTNRNAAVSASSSNRADARVSGDGVRGAVSRTGDRVEGAVKRGANATRRTANRAADSVGNVASRADRRIQGALPAGSGARAGGQANVQGSGTAGGLITAPSK